MSDLGYHNKKQKELGLCFNSLEAYVMGIERAIRTTDEDFERIGLKKDGQYLQLNSHILQIENEYYGQIRPKRVSLNEASRPIQSLEKYGVEYVELRVMDINPFNPVGISLEQIRFIDVFLLYCLLKESPLCSFEQTREDKLNWEKVAMKGREKGLFLKSSGKEIGLLQWGLHIHSELKEVARLLDDSYGFNEYSNSVENFKKALLNSDLTYSGKLLNVLKNQGQSFFQFSRKQAGIFKDVITNKPLKLKNRKKFEDIAKESLVAQKQLEISETISFEEYLKNYFR
jgi:glutamate--cysteine ligase